MPERSGERFEADPPWRVRRPMLLQDWKLSTWIHWPYDPGTVAQVVPPGLELDTFDGRAWVGLVAFAIEGQRPPVAPALPWLSQAYETHLRTYVTAPDGRSGSWFFYLENSLLPGVAIGRAGFFLNYHWSRIELRRRDGVLEYRGARRLPPGTKHDIRVQVGEPYRPGEPTDLDLFVTAQWILFTRYWRRLAAVPVEHPPWPLRKARLVHLEENLLASAGLPPPASEPLVHFSPGVHSRIGRPRLVPQGPLAV
jgi:uncharacterized protein YqjF (DUF2071 family)